MYRGEKFRILDLRNEEIFDAVWESYLDKIEKRHQREEEEKDKEAFDELMKLHNKKRAEFVGDN